METGTEILLARIASNPEEFVEGSLTKWARVMDMAHRCLPDGDKQALKEALNRAEIDLFNGEVLATLAGEREPLGSAENTIRYQAKDRYATGLTDPRNLFSTSIGNGTISTTAYNPAQARAFE
jgi:hypothetical protein